MEGGSNRSRDLVLVRAPYSSKNGRVEQQTPHSGRARKCRSRVGLRSGSHRAEYVSTAARVSKDLAFEWSIEAIDDASCVVRLVNTGFGEGHEWDTQYDAMTEGWRMFMFNLRLHLEHFSGQTATSALPMAMWAGPIDKTWTALTQALGIPSAPGIGERIEVKSLRCARSRWHGRRHRSQSDRPVG